MAAVTRNEELFKLLLDYGAEVNFQNINGKLPLHLITWITDQSTILTVIERTANVNQRDATGYTVLHHAAREGNAVLVESLLGCGANVSATTRVTNSTALHIVVEKNPPDILKVVKFLLKYGADPNVRDNRSNTPLLFALDRCNLEIITLFAEYGADFTAQISQGESALHYAVHNPHVEVISLVLDNGIDVNSQNYETALHIAARRGAIDACKILLDRGADIWCKDNISRKSPLLLYVEERNWRSVFGSVDHNKHVAMLLVAHTVKLKYLNFVIHPDDLNLIECDPELGKYYEACNHEIEKMQGKNIDGHVSLFDVLFASQQKMSTFAKNKELVAAIDKSTPDLCKDLPYFSGLLAKFQNEVLRQKKINKAAKVISDIMDLPDPTHLVCQKIVSYLKEADLETLGKL